MNPISSTESSDLPLGHKDSAREFPCPSSFLNRSRPFALLATEGQTEKLIFGLLVLVLVDNSQNYLLHRPTCFCSPYGSLQGTLPV